MHVLATAGHVDHGKSTLVRALTGMEPDRFAEERRRGMTIDLGYAWTALPSGRQLAFVDVPGHQRFIANMLAGLGPTPAVLFVVAADEGWSRQSAEHLAAVDALGVRHGLLAVTRSDLADPAPALADAQARLAASSLGDVEAVAVSGATGAGLDVLRAALDRLVARLPAPLVDAPVRLWIDRSFTVRGSGTVVTGTLAGGHVAVGDTLLLRGRPVTVRSVQSTGETLERADSVARVALNLRGVDRDDIGRGDVLLTAAAWYETRVVDVRLDVDADTLPAELVLHVGTAAVPVHVRPLGGVYARLRAERALPWRAGDRAVLRDPGRQSVAAGVLVVDADPPELRRRGAAARRAAELEAAGDRPDARHEITRRGAVRRAHLARLGVPVGAGIADVHGVGDWLVADATWRAWLATTAPAVDAWAASHPLEPGVPAAALRRALRLPDDAALLTAVVTAAGMHSVDGRIRRPDAAPTALPPGVTEIVRRLTASPFAAPERDDLAALRVGPRELAAAVKQGALLRVAADLVLLPSAPAAAVTALRALPQPFTTSEARQALGTTRRVAIPLLEHLDAQGLTERLDTTRRRVR